MQFIFIAHPSYEESQCAAQGVEWKGENILQERNATRLLALQRNRMKGRLNIKQNRQGKRGAIQYRRMIH